MTARRRGLGHVCFWCRRQLEPTTSRSSCRATRDHLMPQWAGGSFQVWACFTCNNLKGGMLPREWSAYRAAHPEWWKQ